MVKVIKNDGDITVRDYVDADGEFDLGTFLPDFTEAVNYAMRNRGEVSQHSRYVMWLDVEGSVRRIGTLHVRFVFSDLIFVSGNKLKISVVAETTFTQPYTFPVGMTPEKLQKKLLKLAGLWESVYDYTDHPGYDSEIVFDDVEHVVSLAADVDFMVDDIAATLALKLDTVLVDAKARAMNAQDDIVAPR